MLLETSGYLGLFFASFLAATVVPFSSEAILSGMLVAGYNPVISLIVASLGNWLGGLTSFGIGWMGKTEWITRVLKIEPSKIDIAHRYISGKETWISLFCWLPVVGDVFAVALGVLRANFWLTATGMLIGKTLRYAVWGWMTLKTMELIG
jgi:membrane protein YqaA with SNARE-associated domain